MLDIENILNRIVDLKTLPNVNIEIIGYSLLSKPIYAVHVGSYDGPQMIMDGGIHAREYLSTLFLIEEVKYLSIKSSVSSIVFVWNNSFLAFVELGRPFK